MTEATREEMCRAIAEKVLGMKVVDASSGVYFGHCAPIDHRGIQTFSDGHVEIRDNCVERFVMSPDGMVEIMEKMKAITNKIGIVMQSYFKDWFFSVVAISDKDEFFGSGPTPMHAVTKAAYALSLTL